MTVEGGQNLQGELELLKSRLKQVEDRASLWMNEEASQLVVSQENRHKEALKKLQDEKLKIQAHIAAQQKEAVETNQMMEKKCKKLEDLKTELEKLYSYTHELNTVKVKTEQDVDTLKRDVEQIRKDIEVPTKNRQKLEYLSKSSGVFGSMMGLTLKKTTGKRLQVTFTHIDEKDPLMPFYFFLQIQEPSKKYVVSDPEPPVDGLEEMVQTLNVTNNIRQFIIAMRKKFQETVKKP